MQLKGYQELALKKLGEFFENSLVSSPKEAYEKIVDKEKLRGFYTPYYEIPGLEKVPYCCIRIPTGGGKTILASNAVKVFKDNYLYDREYPTVLWLVPSNTIRKQTVEALKNYRHPYREALNSAFGDRVKIFDISVNRDKSGIYFPVSHLDTVLLVTPIFSANSDCFIFFSLLISPINFPILD